MIKEIELWNLAWSQLHQATLDKEHEFSNGTISTISKSGVSGGRALLVPASRTVVLRKCDRKKATLTAYTDKRSAKVRELEESGFRLAWCFWAKELSLQISGWGEVIIDDSQKVRTRFAQLPKHSRKAYATTLAPGSELHSAGDGLPENWEALDVEETEYAANNFSVLETRMMEMDILSLSRKGHKRLHGVRDRTSDEWDLTWIVP